MINKKYKATFVKDTTQIIEHIQKVRPIGFYRQLDASESIYFQYLSIMLVPSAMKMKQYIAAQALNNPSPKTSEFF